MGFRKSAASVSSPFVSLKTRDAAQVSGLARTAAPPAARSALTWPHFISFNLQKGN